MIKYEELNLSHVSELKLFLDKEAGFNYMTEDDLKDVIENNIILNNLNASFIAKDNEKIIGLRLTYVPVKWIKDGKGATFSKWNVDKSKVAKFHCLFIDNNYRGQGIGPKMSKMSVDVLREMGAKAIICYSWLESFNNSSQKYLIKYGFSPVNQHPNFWADLEYDCSGCNVRPCTCTAEEMIYYL